MSQNDFASEALESADAAEVAVRRYLEFVNDPSSAIDHGRIERLEGELASTSDVIAKLKLHAELARAKEGDVAGLRAAFALHAKGWAQRNDIGLDAFRALGVNDIALAEAGFDLGRGVATKSRTAPAAPRMARAPRSATVSSADVRANMLARTEPFTLAAVMADVGGSLGTIRKVIDDLVDAGTVRNEGSDKTHTGRGRAPHLFRVV